MNNKMIFNIVSLVGLALGGIGTLLSNWADKKELDEIIDEKVTEKLADYRNNEENEMEES